LPKEKGIPWMEVEVTPGFAKQGSPEESPSAQDYHFPVVRQAVFLIITDCGEGWSDPCRLVRQVKQVAG
jgi:hypothetical protein